MKNVITIQHTQSIQHTNGMIGSWTDWDLTDTGIEHAKNIGKRLSHEIKDRRYVMYSSDLLRAKHTAEIVAGYLDINPIYTLALREQNLGEAVGRTKEWARDNVMCPVWSNTIDWAIGIDDRPFIGAESKRDVWNRLLDFYNIIMASKNENIICVSHSGTLSIYYAMWLGLNAEMLSKCDLHGNAGGVSFMREDEDGRHILSRLNDLSYIRYYLSG